MKPTVFTILSVVGALTIVALGVRMAARLVVPPYEVAAQREFGGPNTIAGIESLYQRLESSPKDAELKIVTGTHYHNGKIRRIPQS